MTLNGAARPIVWLGHGQVLATRGHRSAATPVIVHKGALADNVPQHDLHVTKGHSLLIDGVLIPVEFLVNHRSIVWDDHAQEVSLYHLELERHDVLIANGAPAESYRDDGNRWLFQNANSGWELPPQRPCAPVLTGGPVVDAAWRRLLERAGARPTIPVTDDPDLHLLADGRRIDASGRQGDRWLFRLTRFAETVRIVSRTGVPAELGHARDPRELGVAIRRIICSRGATLRVVEADDRMLSAGFHRFEADNGFRWTSGDAPLPAALFQAMQPPFSLELHVGSTTVYALAGHVRVAA
jgi:Hint domain